MSTSSCKRSHIILRLHGFELQAFCKPQANRRAVAVGPVSILWLNEPNCAI